MNFLLFLAAASVIAAVPGPGIFYVAARTLSGGRKAGIASTFGTALGGLVHVIAGALGVSADHPGQRRVVHRAQIRRRALSGLAWHPDFSRRRGRRCRKPIEPVGAARAFRDGVLVEALNPKTAAFFLAFIPQFIDAAGDHPALQFIALGLISVTLNTLADVVVVMMAATARNGLVRRPHLLQRLRQGSGLFIAGLGISLALVRRPASYVGWCKGALAPCPPSIPDRDAEWWARFALPTLRNHEFAELTQRPRMHPPAGMIAPDLLGGALGVGGVLDRSQSRSRRSPTSAPARRRWWR